MKKSTHLTKKEEKEQTKSKERKESKSDLMKGAIDKKSAIEFKDQFIAQKREKKQKKNERRLLNKLQSKQSK